MHSSEWTADFPGWTVDSPEWTGDSPEWTVHSTESAIHPSGWTAERPEWTTDSREWTVDSRAYAPDHRGSNAQTWRHRQAVIMAVVRPATMAEHTPYAVGAIASRCIPRGLHRPHENGTHPAKDPPERAPRNSLAFSCGSMQYEKPPTEWGASLPIMEKSAMARPKQTSKKAATSASKVLRSKSTGKRSKSAAGSALTQRESLTETTGKKAATAASKTLRDKRTSKASKSAAGSALVQVHKAKRKPKGK